MQLLPTLLLAAGLIVTGAQEPGDDQAIEKRVADARARRGDHYANKLHEFILEARDLEKGGIVFLGDSLTEGFPDEDAFPGDHTINRGVSGDVIRGVIERLDVSALDLEPRRVYVLIGVNEFAWQDIDPPETLRADYTELYSMLKEGLPEAEVFVKSILPVGRQFHWAVERIEAVNGMLRELAAEFDFTYIDLYARMAGPNGFLKPDYSADGIHLTLKGYYAWMETLIPAEQFAGATLALAPYWKEYHGTTRHVDRVNPQEHDLFPGGRGPNELVVYTPAHPFPSTGTNPWGTEARVSGGMVMWTGGNDSPIPANGFVISGHGSAGAWISFNLFPGTRVRFDGQAVSFAPRDESGLPLPERLGAIRNGLINAMILHHEREPGGELFAEARALLIEVTEHLKAGTLPPPERMTEIDRRRWGLLEDSR